MTSVTTPDDQGYRNNGKYSSFRPIVTNDSFYEWSRFLEWENDQCYHPRRPGLPQQWKIIQLSPDWDKWCLVLNGHDPWSRKMTNVISSNDNSSATLEIYFKFSSNLKKRWLIMNVLDSWSRISTKHRWTGLPKQMDNIHFLSDWDKRWLIRMVLIQHSDVLGTREE